MRHYRWAILGFLLIMLTSAIAGLRQCQGMRLTEQRRPRPINQAWEEFRAKHFDERPERVIVGSSPAVEAKSGSHGAPRRKPPLVFDKTLSDALAQIAQSLAGVIAIACVISYVVLLRFDTRDVLTRIVNSGVMWVRKRRPDARLTPAGQATGSRQD